MGGREAGQACRGAHRHPGTGKTSAALALAADYGWDVVEMNASDQRNAEAIKGIAMRGAIGQTFTPDGEYHSTKSGKLKLIILDEADNISGREDGAGCPRSSRSCAPPSSR
jgi:replication factor C large subunit